MKHRNQDKPEFELSNGELGEELESEILGFLTWPLLLDALDPTLLDEVRERIQQHRADLEERANQTFESYEKNRMIEFLEISQSCRSRQSAILLPLRLERHRSDPTDEALDMLDQIMDGYRIYRSNASEEDRNE